MKIIFSTNDYQIKVDDDIYAYLNQYNWHVMSNGKYATRGIWFNGEKILISMASAVLDYHSIEHPHDIDHVDHDKLNNQLQNLRPATKSQNATNKKITKRNVSGYKGVSFNKRKDRWKAEIKKGGISYFLGYYDAAIKAARAYDKAAIKYHGEFACLNFPDEAKKTIKIKYGDSIWLQDVKTS